MMVRDFKNAGEVQKFILDKNTENVGSQIIANFHMKTIYGDQGDYGHFSPIVKETQDKCCIGDTWPDVPEYTWVSYEKLLEAVETVDKDSGEKRGFICFNLLNV